MLVRERPQRSKLIGAGVLYALDGYQKRKKREGEIEGGGGESGLRLADKVAAAHII